MDGLSNQVAFSYQFTTDETDIPKSLKKDPSVAFRIEGDFEIKINGTLYFKENIALLEFYLYLRRWISGMEKNKAPREFQYYSLEYDEDEPIISVIPFNQKARLASIWALEQVYNIFDWDYLVEKLSTLCDELGKDIEKHYNIKLKTFINKVPLKKQ
jgi:hypothetical protein